MEELSGSPVHQHSMSSNIVPPRCNCSQQFAEAVPDLGGKARQAANLERTSTGKDVSYVLKVQASICPSEL